MSRFVRGKVAQATADNLKIKYVMWACGAAVAQRTHNPLVVGSNPTGPKFFKAQRKLCFFILRIVVDKFSWLWQNL